MSLKIYETDIMKYKLTQTAKLFTEIKNQDWWKLFVDDKDFYINIRKDNYINVYYLGGSVAKLEYSKGEITAQIHEKYLGVKDSEKYTFLNLATLNQQKIADIKNLIEIEYLSRKSDDYRAEKWIQGDIITSDTNLYIDSEFAYYKDTEIGRLRIDITKLSNGVLQFIELKGIYNGELRNKDNTINTPHIIEQITRYRNFIISYEKSIIQYYQTLCDIRYSLGIGEKVAVKSIEKEPFLWIQDTYSKYNKQRRERITDIVKLLKLHNINYQLCK